MENEDLKKVWDAFNKNIDSVENTQKHILKQMISRKTEIRLQIMKFQSIIGILVAPIIFVFVIGPLIINYENTPHLLIGSGLITGVLIYGFIQAVKYYNLIHSIRLAFEPVIKTQERIVELKKFMTKMQNRNNLSFLICGSGCILVIWNNFNYESPVNIAILVAIFIAVYFVGKLKHKLYFRDRIDSIVLEMNELKEYQ